MKAEIKEHLKGIKLIFSGEPSEGGIEATRDAMLKALNYLRMEKTSQNDWEAVDIIDDELKLTYNINPYFAMKRRSVHNNKVGSVLATKQDR